MIRCQTNFCVIVSFPFSLQYGHSGSIIPAKALESLRTSWRRTVQDIFVTGRIFKDAKASCRMIASPPWWRRSWNGHVDGRLGSWASRSACRAPLLIYQAQLFDHVLPELRSPAFESAAK